MPVATVDRGNTVLNRGCEAGVNVRSEWKSHRFTMEKKRVLARNGYTGIYKAQWYDTNNNQPIGIAAPLTSSSHLERTRTRTRTRLLRRQCPVELVEPLDLSALRSFPLFWRPPPHTRRSLSISSSMISSLTIRQR